MAPEGPQTVATGGAQRNPWAASSQQPAPEGQRHVPGTHHSLAPPGRNRRSFLSTGCAPSGPPPVATIRRTFGACKRMLLSQCRLLHRINRDGRAVWQCIDGHARSSPISGRSLPSNPIPLLLEPRRWVALRLIQPTVTAPIYYAACSINVRASSRSTETSWLTPFSAMVTPNKRFMRDIVCG